MLENKHFSLIHLILLKNGTPHLFCALSKIL
nr:MAG TPA: Frog antimicrobial peptide [Caudoviricetes sp.]